MQGIKLYNHLKKKISEILINNNSSVFTYSISLLNLIKAHPYHLRKYLIINETDKLRNIKIFFLELYYFLKFFHYFFDKQIIYKQKKFSNIFISHYMNNAQNLNKDPNYIINKNSLAVYINHTNKKIYNNRLNNCVILARRLNLIDEFKIIKNQLVERKRLLKKYNRKKDFFIRLVAADAISPSTITNNRIANQIKNLIKYYKPKNFITTFEGYSWEKIVIYFANNLKYKCVTFGYIPNLLLKNYGSNVIKYKHIFYPKKILVSGSYTKKKICDLKHLRNKVHVIGTIKNFPRKFKLNKIKNNNILVIPEGIKDELNIFIKFIKKNKKIKGLKFILRLHPVIKNDHNKYLKLLKGINNIILSNETLQNDFNRSKFVLFRGSNLVVNCIKNGLIPLYLCSGSNELNINPIYDMNIPKITKSKDLQKILKTKYKYRSLLDDEKLFSKYKFNFFD